MTKAEKYISELNKMKTKENAPVIEGIIKGFNQIQASKEYKQKTIRDSIAQLEAARGTQNPVKFLKTITSNVLKSTDKKAQQEAMEGIVQYKKYLVEAFSGAGLNKAMLANCLSTYQNMANTAQSREEVSSIIDQAIDALTKIKSLIANGDSSDIVTDDPYTSYDQSVEQLPSIEELY